MNNSIVNRVPVKSRVVVMLIVALLAVEEASPTVTTISLSFAKILQNKTVEFLAIISGSTRVMTNWT